LAALSIGLADECLKDADTIDEAVGQYYENPDKYLNGPVPSKPKQVYDPPARTMGLPRHQHHTNAVIEAGNVRARDEVRFALILCGDELTSSS
jgi:hypothetical protein